MYISITPSFTFHEGIPSQSSIEPFGKILKSFITGNYISFLIETTNEVNQYNSPIQECKIFDYLVIRGNYMTNVKVAQ